MTYTTKTGDTFDSIAKNILGDREYTKDLIESNAQYITTVIFSAGVKLELPVINEDHKAVGINKLPPWRSDSNESS